MLTLGLGYSKQKIKHGVPQETILFLGAKRLVSQGTDLPKTCRLLTGNSSERAGPQYLSSLTWLKVGGKNRHPGVRVFNHSLIDVTLSKLPHLPLLPLSHL